MGSNQKLVAATAPVSVFQKAYKIYELTSVPSASSAKDFRTPEDALMHSRYVLAFVLAIIGASSKPYVATLPMDETALAEWASWIGTLASLNFGNFYEDNTIRSAVQEIPPTVKQMLRDMSFLFYETHQAKSVGTPATPAFASDADVMTFVNDIGGRLGLPVATETVASCSVMYVAFNSGIVTSCYFALVCYLAGRPPTINTDAISVRRPANLEDKFLNKKKHVILSGVLKMSIATINYVSNTFSLDGRLREAIMWPMIRLTASANGPNEGAVATMVTLLAWSQWAYIPIIKTFLARYAWVGKIPELAGELNVLATEVETLLTYPAEALVYLKMLKRDTIKELSAKNLEQLTALAVAVMKIGTASLAAYQVKPVNPVILNKFNAQLLIEEAAVSAPAPAP